MGETNHWILTSKPTAFIVLPDELVIALAYYICPCRGLKGLSTRHWTPDPGKGTKSGIAEPPSSQFLKAK